MVQRLIRCIFYFGLEYFYLNLKIAYSEALQKITQSPNCLTSLSNGLLLLQAVILLQITRMSKTTYSQRFEKVSKFYDNAYHHHKATFKGFGEFFRSYCALEKDYANQLLRLSEGVNSTIADFVSQLPYIQQGMREVCGNLQRNSQLHFNFAQRLREISDACREEYNTSKRGKEKFMKLNFEKSQEEHDKVKESRNRNMINEKEKEICCKLYKTIDQFMEDESARTQKLKEQLVIYFSLSKKIAEKELQLTGAYSLKMAQYDIHVKVPQLAEIEDMIVDQFNSYGEEKLQKKERQVNQQIAVHRESLRDSIVKRERQIKIEDYQSKMQQVIAKYSETPEELNYPDEPNLQVGLFDTHSITNYRIYTGEFKSESIRELAFAWLSCFYIDCEDDEKSFLTVIKTNLKVKAPPVEKAKDVQQFIDAYAQKSEDYRWMLHFLVELSQFYNGNISLQDFNKVIRNKRSFQIKKAPKPLHWRVHVVIIDALLESLIIIRDGYSLLYDQYIDILKMITTFAKKIFDLDPTIPLLLLLRKFQWALSITNSTDEQIIEQVFHQKLEGSTEALSETQPLRMDLGHRIINFLTQKMSKFYSCKIAFSNLVKLSLCVQKALPKNYFTAIQHMHKCIKLAGFNFLVETDEEKKVLEGGIWRGEERLRNLTQILQEVEYDRIREDYFEPIAHSLAKLIGVGYEVIMSKMLREFLAPTWEVIQCNLSILAEQEGTDREGYVLRLGLCLAQLDLQLPQGLSAYDPYFRVLETYLAATQKDYDTLLEHSRKTELWIVQQNSQATQNCIDFCSLLYKPFEFLLSSLKKLEQNSKQTQFTKKYTNFIKLKLNDALKGQIEKYVKFLIDSLANYASKEPQLVLKQKRTEVIIAKSDDITKERYGFRQMTRRLFNLIFLKEQLQEIVSDFIEKDVYEQLDFSIFNLQLLKKAAAKPSTRSDLLTNISHIAGLIANTQTKLVSQMAGITVFHFLRRLFSNLYWQEERGFFTSGDVKLSQHTLQKYESELQEVLMGMSRNIPPEGVDQYSRQVCVCFFRAYRIQVLNVHKFKVGLTQQSILTYLKSDLAFACALLRKKFLDSAFVREGIEELAKILFNDLQQGSQKIMEKFSDASMKNNNQQARYLLALLNLRTEEKAQDFVQKYKKVLK